MTEKTEPYMVETFKDYDNSLKKLNLFQRAIWTYLRRSIVRKSSMTASATWSACAKIYKGNNVLSANISISVMVKDLGISDSKIRRELNELHKRGYIIKYASKNSKQNNTNIYILGFLNTIVNDNGDSKAIEKFFLHAPNILKEEHKNRILSLYEEQVKAVAKFEASSNELFNIQEYLFKDNN